MSKNLADRIYNNQQEASKLEDEIYASLETAFGSTECGRLTYDYYDRSFEAYQFEPFDMQPTVEQLAKIWALGFERFWIHKGDKRVDGPERDQNERYFWRGAP